MDTLRDRRTLIAMVVVPMVLYPAMMLGSLQGFELQVSRLKQEEYKVAVQSEEVAAWLRNLIDTDPTRRPGAEGRTAEEIAELDRKGELVGEDPGRAGRDESAAETARADVRQQPPNYEIEVIGELDQLRRQVADGSVQLGLLVSAPLPAADSDGSGQITLLVDQTEIRSQIAASGLEGIFQRASEFIVAERLKRVALQPEFVKPIEVRHQTIATPEKVGGSILGQIVPLILVIMTITGAIYPAIDLTAGERERGTLETLMVAPVPTVDLIAGKFIVVALIAMLSAALNLLSIGGTIYLGGLGSLLTRGGQVVIPLNALPWVLLVLVPLAVMFSAALLAVCSFARSFKEAQNYVMPVMIAALIPAVVGVLPGTRLSGPLLIMPVTNIVLLARDLFTGRFDLLAIVWVTVSTTLYAGAAVAVAARLFGQEAVLFADSGSVKTIFRRRFFKPADQPSVAAAGLLLALVFSVNFFVQQSLLAKPGRMEAGWFWYAWAAVVVTLFLILPAGLAGYMRVRLRTAFALSVPRLPAVLAGLCFGLSTWVLARVAFVYQSRWLPLPPELEQEFQNIGLVLAGMNPLLVVTFLALVPAVCEELFFRGYVLSGLCRPLGKVAAVVIVAVAFGLHHHSIHRLLITSGLGVLFGLLVVRYHSIWPAVLAHFMHNGLGVLSQLPDGLQPLLARAGYPLSDSALPPTWWTIAAAVLTAVGLLLCLAPAATARRRVEQAAQLQQPWLEQTGPRSAISAADRLKASER